jgi:cytochrome c oxidase cbb3-type subunit 4
MDAFFSLISSAFTVITFVTFIGIVVWAYSTRRREAFAQAANAPFALPDDVAVDNTAERQS